MQDLLQGTWHMLGYFVIAAGTALTCRMLIRIPDELFRKLLHCILLGSFPVFLFGFSSWKAAAGEAVGFALIVYPILAFFERFPGFSKLTTERKHGELKHSLLLVFGMFAFVITVCWGWLGEPYLALGSVFAWGFGDAAAALVGKRFGRHRILWKYTDGKKSFEGSAAMFLVSFLSVVTVLMLWGRMAPARCILIAAIVSLVSTLAELYAKNGNDTVICPVSAMCALLPLVCLAGGLS